MRKLHKIGVFWGKVAMWLLLSPPKVYGAIDPAYKNKPLVIVSNHQSQIDIFAALASYPVDFLFMSKKEVFDIPLIGTIMRKVGYISVDRQNPTKAAVSVKEAIANLKKGHAVLIYPEGTRNPNAKEMLPFKLGTLKIAMEGAFPILPIVVYGTQEIQSKEQRFFLWPHRTAIWILDVIREDDQLHPANKNSPLTDGQKLEGLRAIMMDAYARLAQNQGRLS